MLEAGLGGSVPAQSQLPDRMIEDSQRRKGGKVKELENDWERQTQEHWKGVNGDRRPIEGKKTPLDFELSC